MAPVVPSGVEGEETQRKGKKSKKKQTKKKTQNEREQLVVSGRGRGLSGNLRLPLAA